MVEISASLVKNLREKTGAGMMDCKKALTETQGDFEQAVDWLRKKGLSAAAQKSSRVAAEGLVGVAAGDKDAAVVEVNAETDFVARNEQFQNMVRQVAQTALQHKGSGDLQDLPLPQGKTVAEELTHCVAVIGENMYARRAAYLSVASGVVATYVHAAVTAGLGKIGVLVALASAADRESLLALGKRIAMHIAASAPQALSTEDVPAENVQRERSILLEQAKASGRSADVIEKMVEGRLRKYFEEVVLLEQAFVMEPDKKVRTIVEEETKRLGHSITVQGFVRFALGEGVTKSAVSFADEVAAQLGK